MKITRSRLNIIVCTVLGVTTTYFLNHHMGYGAIISSGLVGVFAALLLPAPLAGATYTASFVGMSSQLIIPNVFFALTGGLIVGIIIIGTTQIYAGIGGKGGTTAAMASLITRALTGLFS